MLYDSTGHRKYLTKDERQRFIEAAKRQPPPIDTFCLTLAFTGARISEVLALRASNIDVAAGIIVIESLKKRRKGVFRQVPVPDFLLHRLVAIHCLGQVDPQIVLWKWSRTTAWKRIKATMDLAGCPTACAAPKALRHAFGVVGIAEANVPLNMMQKWLGHSRIETTAIYANAIGKEERTIASRMWSNIT
ncbi:tyrosine-type recombinase/integrase [Novosphingobium naphthalenivorans]|uniref:tyrosine-type recombinase/integrase n=1 Tax=Novosphingobium naphthalenivorans TaxID=273168 RepID=UPI0008345B59|nr:tyrosine-type recombinase/integrase [Novosphingobium naphthalenivorans]